MVTETNEPGSESTVEVTEGSLNLDDGVETSTQDITEDLTETNDPPIEVTPS